MNINISLIDFLRLFDSNVQYSIPTWQRRYSWNKFTIKQLVSDLEAIAKNQRKDAMHFGGTLITYLENASPGTAQIYNVVDGQQRLTTISILLVCIAERLDEIGSDKQDWSSEKIRNVLLRNSMDPPKKLRLQDGDNEEYKRIFEGRSGGGGKVTEAYRFLQETVRGSDPHLLMEGLRRFKVINFPCESSHDPQQIFESLNATGVRLTEGEKVKNWLLMGLDRKTQETVYKDHWCKLESRLDAISEPKRIDEFLRDFLRWKTGENKGIKYSYPKLRRWWYGHDKGTRTYLCEELARLATLYGRIVGVNGQHKNDRVDRILRHLRALGLSVYRPLALRFFDDATRPDETGAYESELLRSLKALETWLTRIWIAGDSPRGFNTSIINLAHDRGPGLSESYADYWTKKIQKLRNSGTAVPNEEEIREGIRKRNAYRGNASHAAKTILWEINASLGNPASPRIEDLSLEHIMPQTLSEEWKKYLGENREYLDADIKEIHEIYVDSLANLTLVGKEYNSEISNRIYTEKRKLYKDSSFMLTRKLAESYVDWREEDMDARVDELARQVLKCWPWEDTIRAKARWRIDGGGWQKEKKYSSMLLNIIASLLDIDQARNHERLLGSRPSRDLFYFEEAPISRGRRFLPIPGYSQYVVNMNFDRGAILRLCGEMCERCNVKVEIEIPKQQHEGQEIWDRVDLKNPRVSNTKRMVPHWRINQGGWRPAKTHVSMLLSVVKELLDINQGENSGRLLGDRPGKDLFRSGTEPISSGRRFRPIPGYTQYAVNLTHNSRSIVNLCVEMGERCGVKVDIKHFEEQDGDHRKLRNQASFTSSRAYLTPRWRIGNDSWNEERSHRDVLLNVASALLDIDPEGNYHKLSGNKITKDIFPAYVHSDGRDFGRIPGYPQYVVYNNLTRSDIVRKCKELGERCGVSVDVE